LELPPTDNVPSRLPRSRSAPPSNPLTGARALYTPPGGSPRWVLMAMSPTHWIVTFGLERSVTEGGFAAIAGAERATGIADRAKQKAMSRDSRRDGEAASLTRDRTFSAKPPAHKATNGVSQFRRRQRSADSFPRPKRGVPGRLGLEVHLERLGVAGRIGAVCASARHPGW
jgi:hypothetical protein